MLNEIFNLEGGIFWCYGLVTFARFLGSFSELGWAWNRAPCPDGRKSGVSAEFVESLVIFVYGATNTWMERFGVSPSTPYSTKEIQHISIAVSANDTKSGTDVYHPLLGNVLVRWLGRDGN